MTVHMQSIQSLEKEIIYLGNSYLIFSLTYPISILISNVVVAHYGKNIGVSFLENEIRHFHGGGHMDIVENQILQGSLYPCNAWGV